MSTHKFSMGVDLNKEGKSSNHERYARLFTNHDKFMTSKLIESEDAISLFTIQDSSKIYRNWCSFPVN